MRAKTRDIAVRAVCAAAMAAALALGVRYVPDGVCLGDRLLAGLGLPAWSDGTQGLHYTALVSLAVFAGAAWGFACTTRRQKRTVCLLFALAAAALALLSLAV